MGNGRQNRRRDNKGAMMVISAIVCVLFAVLLIQGISLRNKVVANDLLTEQLQSDISAEEERTLSIESMRDELSSEENIKNTARDKYGLVDDSQIIFKSAGK